MQQELTFKQWLAALDAEATKYANIGYIAATGEDAWRGYYNDGYSPEAAYQEDCSYA